jgi:hypothetical protein
MCMAADLINAFLLCVVVVGCQWWRWMEYCSDFGSANHAPARPSLNDSNRCDENEQRVPLGAGGQEKRRAWDVVVQVVPRSARWVCKSALQDLQEARNLDPQRVATRRAKGGGLRAVAVLWTKIGTKQPCWGWDWDWEWGAKCGEERQSMAGGCSAWRRGDQGSCSCTTCVCRRARDQTYSVASCNSCQTTTAIAGLSFFSDLLFLRVLASASQALQR